MLIITAIMVTDDNGNHNNSKTIMKHNCNGNDNDNSNNNCDDNKNNRDISAFQTTSGAKGQERAKRHKTPRCAKEKSPLQKLWHRTPMTCRA